MVIGKGGEERVALQNKLTKEYGKTVIVNVIEVKSLSLIHISILVLVGSAQNGDDLTIGGQGDGAGHAGTSVLCGLHDLLCCGIDQLSIIAPVSYTHLDVYKRQ